MNRTEAAELKDAGGRMRPIEAHARPLPWQDLADVFSTEVATDFEWTPQAEEAFLLLLAKGYSVRRITTQNRPGWPKFSDYLWKTGQDPDFLQKIREKDFLRADALVEKAEDAAQEATPATISCARLVVENSWRTASALHPQRYGQKANLGISGGLILAAGSLAELAAQAVKLGQPAAEPYNIPDNSPAALAPSSTTATPCASDAESHLASTLPAALIEGAE